MDGRAAGYTKTVYNQAFDKFSNYINELSEQGRDVQVLAQKIYKISNLKKAKSQILNGTIGASILPDAHFAKKLVDKMLGKILSSYEVDL